MRRAGTFYVRTAVQKALWDIEIAGQISDGHWENAGPRDHWMAWCGAECKVAQPGAPVGRLGFFPRRERYNLTDATLLEVVGARMLRYARVARALGVEAATKVEKFGGLDGDISRAIPAEKGDYWDEMRAGIEAMKQTDEYDAIVGAQNDESYTMTDLKRDLREIKAAMRIQITAAPAAAAEIPTDWILQRFTAKA